LLQRCAAGVAHFSQLRIDRAGQRYRLRFTYLAFNSTTRDYSAQPVASSSSSGSSSSSSSPAGAAPTSPLAARGAPASLSAESPFFEVQTGAPHAVVVSRQPAGAVAGGSAFATQPAVRLVDVGGNTVASDSQSVAVASVVASPSVGRTVRVDTRRAPAVQVRRISSAPAHRTVAPGDRVTIVVEFDQEVTLGATSALPTLALGLEASATPGVSLEATARRSGVGQRRTAFAFNFTVPLGLQGGGSQLLEVSGAWGRPRRWARPCWTTSAAPRTSRWGRTARREAATRSAIGATSP
jgi:hypothetical protein